jgi:CO dehydrogenase nickel-insertion accessory protein CooC1
VAAARELGFEVNAYLPPDPVVAELDMQGQPLLDAPASCLLRQAVRDLLAQTRTVGPLANAAGKTG